MHASQNAGLVSLLESPRARGVDLSYLDDASGTSLLHEAARRKDLRLIELAVRAGANVFVRDRRGKMAWDGTGKDDHVRVFLRQCIPFAPSLLPTVLANYGEQSQTTTPRS
jgi:ankyrin repeat protein